MARNARILLVEDSATQALQLCAILEQEGWQVTSEPSAESALAGWQLSRPDLVVVDYYLPGMRGDELCRRIREGPASGGVPILMLARAEGASLALESGANACVSKSEGPIVLVRQIRDLLGGAPARRDLNSIPGRLLIVDDSPTQLELLKRTLENEGYAVDTALTGAEALARLATQTFDCVLVDLVMPGMDGIELCRRIGDLRQQLESPLAVIIVTARETKDDTARGLEAGADDFVSKSSDLEILTARIRALLRRGFYERENRRMIEELKVKELETLRAHADREAAEARAAIAGQLARANAELEETNRQLKQTQMHLIHAEKMASLGQLVAGIAHEINNPLAFVINHLFTVDSGLAVVASEVEPHLAAAGLARFQKVRLRVDEMELGLDRVKQLVVNLRTFSRLDEGEWKDVDFRESVDSVLLFLRHKMAGRIEIEKLYGTQFLVPCYAGQVNQVVMNLVANAIDAIDGPGVIQISTGHSDGTAFISVRDSGSGIPDDIRQRIFEPFFTTKPVGQGTGLGLAISYSIIQAHKGVIEVERVEGGGTQFTVRIPLRLDPRSTQ